MKNENNSIKITLIISAVVILVALLLVFVIFSLAPVSGNTVTVQGVSSMKAMPDLISVNFLIQTRGNTSAEAKDANSIILNKIVDSLVAQGFSKEDLQTVNFNIYPDYLWVRDKQVDNGFIAYHYVKIELPSEDSEKLTSVVDAGVNAGAGVSSIDFELTQESQNKYKAQALELASQDANVKAEAVAKGFNKDVGKLVSVQVNSYNYYPWNVYSAGAMEDSAQSAASVKEVASNIQPSEQEISASVSATFQIK